MKTIKRDIFVLLYLTYHAISFLVRGCVWLTGKLVRKGFVSLVHRSSTLLATTVYGEANVAILVSASVESGLNFNQVMDCLAKIVKKDINRNLRCQVSTFGGFFAWLWEENFSLKDHIREIKGNGSLEVNSLHQQLLYEPFEEEKSPWVVYFLSNGLKDGKGGDFFILKMHHVLADGYSLLGLSINEIFECQEQINVGSFNQQLSPIQFICLEIRSLLQAAISIAEKRCSETPEDINRSYPVLGSQAFQTRKEYYVSSKPLPVADLKKIKNKLGVSFLSVILAGFTKALRNMLLLKQFSIGEKRPDILLITGLPGHPGGLCNHYSVLGINLPVDLVDGKDEAVIINEQIIKSRDKGEAFRNAKTVQILGGLPASKIQSELPPGVALLGSDFPGTQEPLKLLGKEVTELGFWVGPNADLGLHFHSFSYKGEWKLNLAVNEYVLGSREEAKSFSDDVVDCILALE